MKLKVWFLETRPNFLLLSVVLAFLGNSIAWYNGFFNLGLALLAGFGLILTHISVNVLNDYFDYRSGVDLATKRTPFSGGSGILPARLLTPGEVLWFGIISLIPAIAIGVYFTVTKGLPLLPLLLVAVLCIIIYTPYILKTPWPEWVAGLGLGILPVLGTYFAQTGYYSVPALIASVPSGILVHNLLLLNEFPDAKADLVANRKTLPIILGSSGASIIYSTLTLLVYVWIIGAVIARAMPVYSLIALLTLPLAVKAIGGARKSHDVSKLMPAMASNVLMILLTQLLLGIGYILSGLFAS